MHIVSPTRRLRGCLLALALVGAAGGLVACGGSDKSSDGTSQKAPTSTGSSDTAAYDTQLEALYKGTFTGPPSTAPKPAAHKKVFILSCGQSIDSCSVPIKGADDAAKSLGWDTTVIDTHFDTSQASNAVRQAIAAKADAIVTFAIDCAPIKQPLKEARAAGIKTVGIQSLDCSDTTPGEPSLFDHVVSYQEGPFTQWIKKWGASQATWLIAKTKGQAKVLVFTDDTTQVVKLTTDGFLAEMKTCATCQVVEVSKFTGADLGPKFQQQVQQVLLKHPEANSIEVPYDSAIVAGAGPAVQASGRKSSLKIVAGEGFAANLDLLRAGKQEDAGTGNASRWDGFAAVDALVRLFAGQKPVSSGEGIQVYDADHNIPASGPWQPPFDYEAAYAKAWGK
jgi:ribose transport system substrate-binding protein